MKFKTDFTERGYKILCIFGPDEGGFYAGVIERAPGDILGITWDACGAVMDGDERFDLECKPAHAVKAFAVLSKNNGIGLFISEEMAKEVADREGGQVVELEGEYYI